MLPMFRSCWDEDKFLNGPGNFHGSAAAELGSNFKPAEVTQICKDNCFAGYLGMITMLHDIVQGLAD
eukprot:9067308-Pyramimonas_sp.AAC.1